MKSRNCLAVLLSLVLPCVGCSSCANDWKHLESKTLGLNRKVTLYSADGEVIREWKTEHPVELHGGDAWFIAADGTQTTVSGTFIIEEK